jgi:TPR repeat protein
MRRFYRLMYANGDGTTKGSAEAVRWYWESASRGFAAAQHNLGRVYAEGCSRTMFQFGA